MKTRYCVCLFIRKWSKSVKHVFGRYGYSKYHILTRTIVSEWVLRRKSIFSKIKKIALNSILFAQYGRFWKKLEITIFGILCKTTLWSMLIVTMYFSFSYSFFYHPIPCLNALKPDIAYACSSASGLNLSNMCSDDTGTRNTVFPHEWSFLNKFWEENHLSEKMENSWKSLQNRFNSHNNTNFGWFWRKPEISIFAILWKTTL